MKNYRKMFRLGVLCALSALLLSCNKGKTIANINLNNDLQYVVDVYGGEDDFFEPVAGIYPVVEKDGKWQVTIVFEKSKNTTSNKYTAEEFVLYPLDSDEDEIEINKKDVEFQAENKQNALKELLNAQVGGHVKVTFVYTPMDDKVKKELAKKIYSCYIDLTLEEDEMESTTTMSDNEVDFTETEVDEAEVDESNVKSTSSTNWDKVLDEYESYVNQYIALMKKAKNGDMSAVSEYPQMLEKAQRVAEKLEDADDAMTAAQMARYTQITNKMAQAAY